MEFPKRVKEVPPYLYAEMDNVIAEIKRQGKEIINIAHGDPDLTPPVEVIEELKRSAGMKDAHLYPTYWGMIELRERIAHWMEGRFGVKLDPEKEIIILIGAKEGITHLFLALAESGDYGLIPDPAYPTYKASAIFADAVPIELPLLPENDFLPDLGSIDSGVLKRTKVLIINYPNNPTTKVADRRFFQELVEFCRQHRIYIIHDHAYSEIYGGDPPPSILEIEGAREIAVELHTFSKTFNMQGYRIGWACGGKDLIRALAIIKTNTDSGVFVPIQRAALKAFEVYEGFIPSLRERYQKRREIIQGYLRDLGWNYYPSDATIYVWTRMGVGNDSMRFVTELIRKYGVMIGPGAGYGKYGEGFLRFSLTQPEAKIREGMEKFIAFTREWM
ncbi:LL-diaminopimelate aminotransferase [candidate division WOR-3 bacterium]|uniref:LL-diaminopimelate aminotransferase n=1 Tax=candidate division WOR-3 bacterium TaxID=2052148 RepID=A0A660SGJ5_UNCW3|nr:MAG: LL-diaminopimelate aminotransferase [candidate division WOR-3 bacterium]